MRMFPFDGNLMIGGFHEHEGLEMNAKCVEQITNLVIWQVSELIEYVCMLKI